MGTVETANAGLRRHRCTRSQTRSPVVDNSLTVVMMNRIRPTPALGLCRVHSCVMEPALIEEVAEAVRTRSPDQTWNRVDD